MPFPSPPWHLQGQMWLSQFLVRSTGATDRPAGLYGVGFVDYQAGSVLSYQELLVARLVRDGVVPRVNITDIWVNSDQSRDGGRSLWAIPKDLAELRVTDRWLGLAARTSWDASIAGAPVAAARFAGVPRPALRTPVALTTAQTRQDTGRSVVTRVSGSAKPLPSYGTWDFDADGPLGWLRGRTPVLSWRLTDFRVTFGG